MTDAHLSITSVKVTLTKFQTIEFSVLKVRSALDFDL